MPFLHSGGKKTITLNPIGFFRCQAQELYQCPNQPRLDQGQGGMIELLPHQNFEQALDGLDRFSHIWLIFLFDQAQGWKPKIMPPRGDQKVGCLASRSPHRPNAIGMSVLELKGVRGLRCEVGHHDLVDGTPILDIKPYLPDYDSVPHATGGWTDDLVSLKQYELSHTPLAEKKLTWLKERGVDLLALAKVTLELYPLPRKGRRNRQLKDGTYELSCKTWRMTYDLEDNARVILLDIRGGYDSDVLEGKVFSKWPDVPLHLEFIGEFE